MNSSRLATTDVTQTAHETAASSPFAATVPPPAAEPAPPPSATRDVVPPTRRSGLQAHALPGEPRIDVYTAPHKTLRYMLANVLISMGRATFDDKTDVDRVLAELRLVLWACDGHIKHEDVHLRPMLAERASRTVATLDNEHDEHAHHVAELHALMSALEDAHAAGSADTNIRAAIGSTLYLQVSVFVAETLAHMAYEERVVQPLLDRLFTRDELESIQTAIIESITPQDMIVWLRAMLPAADRQARIEMLQRVKMQAPPDVFMALLAYVRPLLRSEDWSAVAQHFSL